MYGCGGAVVPSPSLPAPARGSGETGAVLEFVPLCWCSHVGDIKLLMHPYPVGARVRPIVPVFARVFGPPLGVREREVFGYSDT
ncbi:MAG: hypothetical protein KatS3mg058_4459 [Roseiflexus sp.]|nr:MAG: hypothetical protein KatS3mg058_4459 [Roseiflexus sp.]